MNIYTYAIHNSNNPIQSEENILDQYIQKNNLQVREKITSNSNSSQYKIEKNIYSLFDKLDVFDKIIVAELNVLGHTSSKLLKMMQRASSKSIFIYAIKEDLLINPEDNFLNSLVESMLDIERSSKEKKLMAAKITRNKNKTHLGRKSGRKTKSIFDKHKKKIMRLHKQGVPKNRILTKIQEDDQSLKHTSPQALGQYIKRTKPSTKKKILIPFSHQKVQ